MCVCVCVVIITTFPEIEVDFLEIQAVLLQMTKGGLRG